jgi:hypothetical protein
MDLRASQLLDASPAATIDSNRFCDSYVNHPIDFWNTQSSKSLRDLSVSSLSDDQNKKSVILTASSACCVP